LEGNFKSVYNQNDETEDTVENENDSSKIYLSTIHFETDQIRKQLYKCKNKNLSGPDGIPGFVLKKCAKSLCIPLKILFSYMMENCDIPEQFLTTHTTPMQKIPNPTLIQHFRPIAGTSDIFKTFERILEPQIVSLLKINGFLPDEQYGFRRGRSTTKQITIFYETLLKEKSAGKITDVIYIDVEKAFDKMTFKKIRERLFKAGVSGNLLNIIMYYLKNRKFLVKVNGHLSSQTQATSGVGQGCVLSALIFIIFFAEISELINQFKEIIHFKFADDLKLLYSYSKNEFDPAPLQNALNAIQNWFTDNSMSVAAHKSVHVQFGGDNPNANYCINNVPIERKEVTRDLGFYIKNDLSINHHLETIVSSANAKMYSILKKVITKDSKILVQIFNTYIRPIYEYGSNIFNIPQQNIIDTIEHHQRQFTKIIYQRNNPNVNYINIPSYSERLKLYEMETLHQRRMIAEILLAYDLYAISKNEMIDLSFNPSITRIGGSFYTKSNISNTLQNYHFSSRVSSILNKLKINFADYPKSIDLRRKLSTVNFSLLS
jgi:hypothetical protein